MFDQIPMLVWLDTHMWLAKLRATPNNIWQMPNITATFILKEFRNVILLVDSCHTFNQNTQKVNKK